MPRPAGMSSRATAMTPPTSRARSTRRSADPRPSLVALPHDHRLGRAQQAGHLGDPWRAARRRRGRRGARDARLDLSRRSRFPPTSRAAWRRSRQRGGASRSAWKQARLASRHGAEFERRMAGELPRRLLARRLSRRPDRQPAEGRDAQGVARWRSAPINDAAARDDRRLGRPHRLEQHQDQGDQARSPRRLCRPLYLLRHPRIRHGRRDERHGAARRRHPLWRHLPGLLRLLPPRDPPVGAAAGARHLCDDA